MTTSIDRILQVRVPGTYLTDEDKYQIAQTIIDAINIGVGAVIRNVEEADGYPRGQKVSYRRVEPEKVTFAT